MKIRPGDAFAVTRSFQPESRDVIIRDVFSGAETPAPLASAEFYRAAHVSLSPGGLFVANCGDHSDLTLAKREVAGLLAEFGHVACIADPAMLKGRRYGNIIFLASDWPLPAEGEDDYVQITKRLLGGGVPAHYKDEAWARKFAGSPAAYAFASLAALSSRITRSETVAPFSAISRNSSTGSLPSA